jgi:Cof subfamily protein (haloacid dehalogenase superfamily)
MQLHAECLSNGGRKGLHPHDKIVIPSAHFDHGGTLRTSGTRLVGIDVDGTLVGASGVVHPKVWDAAKRAQELGIYLTLCSGRPAFGVALEYARRLDPAGWHVFQNGASVLNLGEGTSRSTPLPPTWITKLIDRARATGDALEFYGDTSYAVESTSTWAREHAELLGVPFEPRPLDSFQQPIVRAQWLLSPEDARKVTGAPHPGLEVAQSGSPLMPNTQFVGLTREGVTKGAAITNVAAAYGVDLKDVMYVGDSGNDLSALRVVGHPIAMGNADPDVLKAAGRVVGRADDGGLADALEFAIRGS